MSCDNQDKKTQINNNSTPITLWEPKHEVAPIVEEISEKEELDFVETWKNIFATHSFDNYIKQYDLNEFTVIKRSYTGEKNTYDYSGWIQKKRMSLKNFRPKCM
jgi:hypothetical protein